MTTSRCTAQTTADPHPAWREHNPHALLTGDRARRHFNHLQQESAQ